jgi:hypothetical protein
MFYIMKRTQIQLPAWLFNVAHDVAIQKEISLAELVRRGLEYMVATTPVANKTNKKWELPDPHVLESNDPFQSQDWRRNIHMDR